VAKLQAASVPIAKSAAPWDRQMNGQNETMFKPKEKAHASYNKMSNDKTKPPKKEATNRNTESYEILNYKLVE